MKKIFATFITMLCILQMAQAQNITGKWKCSKEFLNGLGTRFSDMQGKYKFKKDSTFIVKIYGGYGAILPFGGAYSSQGNDTICYHYYANSERTNGVRIPCMYDEILVVINNGNETECIYYGPSLEFDDSPEPFLPGFITLDATDFLMKDGKVSFNLNSTSRNYYSQPIELNLRTDEEIQNAGYRLWLQFPEFFWMDVMFEGIYDNNTISISNKTLCPEEKKVFHKESIHDAMNTYRRNLIEAELERENNINYRNQSGI